MTTTILKGFLFAILLGYAAITDIKRREIDLWVCIAILIVSTIESNGSVLGAFLTALPFFIAALIKCGGMGGGDVKLMFASGALLGVWGGVTQTIIGLSLASLFGLVLYYKKGLKPKETQIPLAPFLCAGGILSFIIINMLGVMYI